MGKSENKITKNVNNLKRTNDSSNSSHVNQTQLRDWRGGEWCEGISTTSQQHNHQQNAR